VDEQNAERRGGVEQPLARGELVGPADEAIRVPRGEPGPERSTLRLVVVTGPDR
jgi:hypothetical protein